MSVEKLRPEQRKLWRKTYHQERDRGVEPTVAATRADDAVTAWEERGAFDESDDARAAPQPPRLIAHSHAKMRAVAAKDGFPVFAGDVLTFAEHRTAIVVWTVLSAGGCVTFDVLLEDGFLTAGDTAIFQKPRPGIAADAVVITG
jgi:hypothetical protein